jgi:hypothetical protein
VKWWGSGTLHLASRRLRSPTEVAFEGGTAVTLEIEIPGGWSAMNVEDPD